jgi:hypothetical protein
VPQSNQNMSGFKAADRLLGGLGSLRRRRFLADTPAQGVHQVDDVAGSGSLLRVDWLASALLVDEINESGKKLGLRYKVAKRDSLRPDRFSYRPPSDWRQPWSFKTAETPPQRIFSSRLDTGGQPCLLREWLAKPRWLPAMPWLRGILCTPRQRLEFSLACPG